MHVRDELWVMMMMMKRGSSPVAGRQHHPAAAEDRQEGNPQGGVESHPRGPEGHGGSANAARGESQRSSEGGEKRAFSTPLPSPSRHEKPAAYTRR